MVPRKFPRKCKKKKAAAKLKFIFAFFVTFSACAHVHLPSSNETLAIVFVPYFRRLSRQTFLLFQWLVVGLLHGFAFVFFQSAAAVRGGGDDIE